MKSKILLSSLLSISLIISGCSSDTTVHTSENKSSEEKGKEKVNSILDSSKIKYDYDGSMKIGIMKMSISDFSFLSHRQFHDFFMNLRDTSDTKYYRIYLDNNTVIYTGTKDDIGYFFLYNNKPIKERSFFFDYDVNRGLYLHKKNHNSVLEINMNRDIPDYSKD